MGGVHSKAEGLQLWADSTLWSVVGVVEALRRIPPLLLTYYQLRHRLIQYRPDLVVVIDAPAIHMRLARYLKSKGIRCLYYFPPSAWTSNPRRLRDIHGRADSLIVPFEFTARQYALAGLPVTYLGHPLLDFCLAGDRAETLQALGLPEGRYAALMPGSRTQEIRLLLPIFLEVARRLHQIHPDLVWLLPAANPTLEERIRARVGQVPPWLRLVSGQARRVMDVSLAGLLASGSATLEAALLGLPHLICYRFHRLDYLLGRTLEALGWIKVERFGLPNLVVQDQVVEEFLQDEVEPNRLLRALMPLLEEGPSRTRALQGLQRVRDCLGQAGAVERIAAYVEAKALEP